MLHRIVHPQNEQIMKLDTCLKTAFKFLQQNLHKGQNKTNKMFMHKQRISCILIKKENFPFHRHFRESLKAARERDVYKEIDILL